jgi:hypothetical protein
LFNDELVTRFNYEGKDSDDEVDLK